MNEMTINDHRLCLIYGDITDLDVDAIVNAANTDLLLGSGVAGAIRRAGGPAIQAECDEIGICTIGKAVITGAGRLKARHVIHAVGPMVNMPDGENLLFSATLNSLLLAEERGLTSIALPAISTGVFGFPMHICARLMVEAAIWFLMKEAESLQLIIFCLYDQNSYDAFLREGERQYEEIQPASE